MWIEEKVAFSICDMFYGCSTLSYRNSVTNFFVLLIFHLKLSPKPITNLKEIANISRDICKISSFAVDTVFFLHREVEL